MLEAVLPPSRGIHQPTQRPASTPDFFNKKRRNLLVAEKAPSIPSTTT
ncbi:hypothetical protein [Mesorhizobium sp.]|nr:hypothetical protein [Mesorhizobium sp.]